MLREHENNFKITSRRRVVLNFFSCSRKHPKCLYMSTKTWQRVSYCFHKITEHSPFAKTIYQNYQVPNSPENSRIARSSNRRASQKCWLASENKCGSQHKSEYWRCSWKKFRTPENDAAEKWWESVSIQLYCQKLRVYPLKPTWRCWSVYPVNMLLTKSTFLSLRLDVLVIWPKLTRTSGNCAVIHLISFALGTILEENERQAGTLFPQKNNPAIVGF